MIFFFCYSYLEITSLQKKVYRDDFGPIMTKNYISSLKKNGLEEKNLKQKEAKVSHGSSTI